MLGEKIRRLKEAKRAMAWIYSNISYKNTTQTLSYYIQFDPSLFSLNWLPLPQPISINDTEYRDCFSNTFRWPFDSIRCGRNSDEFMFQQMGLSIQSKASREVYARDLILRIPDHLAFAIDRRIVHFICNEMECSWKSIEFDHSIFCFFPTWPLWG